MECKGDTVAVGGKVCMDRDTNPYINEVIELFVSIDEGLKWNRNFRYFGAAHPQKINGEELLALLVTKTEKDKANAISAILEVLKDTGGYKDGYQKYCIGHKFRTMRIADFVDWSDMEVSSDKVGWPVAP